MTTYCLMEKPEVGLFAIEKIREQPKIFIPGSFSFILFTFSCAKTSVMHYRDNCGVKILLATDLPFAYQSRFPTV